MTEQKIATSGSAWRTNRIIALRASRRLAVLAATVAVGASAPMLIGSGPANASTMVPCTSVPVGSRLEVDCADNDVTAASVNISAFCTNLANISLQTGLAPKTTAHYTRDCGPGAHPIFWIVDSASETEKIEQDYEQQLQRDEQDRQQREQQYRENHHHNDSH